MDQPGGRFFYRIDFKVRSMNWGVLFPHFRACSIPGPIHLILDILGFPLANPPENLISGRTAKIWGIDWKGRGSLVGQEHHPTDKESSTADCCRNSIEN